MMTKDEKENLLQLLLSNNPDTKELAIELLKYYPDLIPEYRIPLEISIFMYGDYAVWRDSYIQIYKAHFSVEQFKKGLESLRIFKKVHRNYIPESIEQELAALRHYEPVRKDYEPYIALNTQAMERYTDLAHFIAKAFPKENHAVSYFQWILQRQPSSEVWSGLGDFYFRKGDYEAAKAAYLEAIALNVANAPAQAQIGAIYFYTEQYEAAIPYFETAAQHTTGDKKANNFASMASAYMHLEPIDKERIKHIFEQGFAASKRTWTLWNTYAIFLREKEGKMQEAIEAYKEGLNIHSRNTLIMTNLAELYADELQDYKTARTYYEQALQYKPDASIYFFVTYISLLVNGLNDCANAFPHYLKLRRKLAENATAAALHSITPQQWEHYQKAEKKLLEWKKS